MNELLTQLLTGKDGETHDIARWSWVISFTVLVGGAVWNAYTSRILGLREFAESVGIVAAAHGAALFAKKDTEPTKDASAPPAS